MTTTDRNENPIAGMETPISTATDTPYSSSIIDPEKSVLPSPAESEGVSRLDATSRPVTGWRWWLVCVAIYTTNFLYGLDNTIVADIQGAIVTQFNQVDKITWLGSGFPLGSIAVILALGKAYGHFDIKYLWIASIAVFELGSVICGAAPTMDVLVVGRVLGGMGAAGMYLGCLNVITTFTTVRERSIYLGFIGLIWGLGTILGPVIGGAFADSSATWRWAFYINLVIIGVICPVFFFFVPSYQPQPGISFLRKVIELDWVGIILNAGIYTSWILVLQFAGSGWSWNDGRTITLFAVLGVLIVLFVLQQYFCVFTTPERRIFPGEFLQRRTLLLLFLLMNCVTATAFVVIFYIPVFFEFVHGDTGIKSSVRLLPYVFMLVAGSLLNGYTMQLFRYYNLWFIFAGVLITIGSALMYTVTSTTSTATIYGFTVLLGIGTGISINAAYPIAAAKVSSTPALIPASISLLNVAQIGGIAHALAIAGVVFQNVAFKNLQNVFDQAGLAFSDEEIYQAVAGTQSTVFASLTGSVKQQAVDGIVDAIRRVYILAIAAGGAMLLGSLFLRREKLFMTAVAGG